MSKKTKQVQLEKSLTWEGVNYAPGINTMPEAAAQSVVKRKFGKIVGDNNKNTSESAEFAPLPLQETMERFQSGDPSDEVFESLKYHQQAIISGQKPGKSLPETKPEPVTKTESVPNEGEKTDETKKETKTETEKVTGLPDDFPMRHVFDKLDFKSVSEIQAKSREDLIALNGIAETTADKALAYGK